MGAKGKEPSTGKKGAKGKGKFSNSANKDGKATYGELRTTNIVLNVENKASAVSNDGGKAEQNETKPKMAPFIEIELLASTENRTCGFSNLSFEVYQSKNVRQFL